MRQIVKTSFNGETQKASIELKHKSMRQIVKTSKSHKTRINSTFSKRSNLGIYNFQTQILLVLSEFSFKMAVLANKCLIKSWCALQEEVKYHAKNKSVIYLF